MSHQEIDCNNIDENIEKLDFNKYIKEKEKMVMKYEQTRKKEKEDFKMWQVKLRKS